MAIAKLEGVMNIGPFRLRDIEVFLARFLVAAAQ